VPSRSWWSVPTAANDWKRANQRTHDDHRPTPKYDVGADHDHNAHNDHSTYDRIRCCWQ